MREGQITTTIDGSQGVDGKQQQRFYRRCGVYNKDYLHEITKEKLALGFRWAAARGVDPCFYGQTGWRSNSFTAMKMWTC